MCTAGANALRDRAREEGEDARREQREHLATHKLRQTCGMQRNPITMAFKTKVNMIH